MHGMQYNWDGLNWMEIFSVGSNCVNCIETNRISGSFSGFEYCNRENERDVGNKCETFFEDVGEQLCRRIENRIVHHLHTNRKSVFNISFPIDQYHCMNWILKDLPMHPFHFSPFLFSFPSWYRQKKTGCKKKIQLFVKSSNRITFEFEFKFLFSVFFSFFF